MASYLIGDIHGCYQELTKLLSEISYNPSIDRLYFAGDLVGRGPQPLEVLKYAEAHDVEWVLGNYDTTLMAVLCGARPFKPQDAFEQFEVMSMAQQKYWLDYMLSKNSYINTKSFELVHASVNPLWTEADRKYYAEIVNNGYRDLNQRGKLPEIFGKFFIDHIRQDTSAELRVLVEASLFFHINRMQKLQAPDVGCYVMPHDCSSQEFLRSIAEREDTYSVYSLQDRFLPKSTIAPDLERHFMTLDWDKHPRYDFEQGLCPWFRIPEFINELREKHPELVLDNPNMVVAPQEKPLYFGHWSYLNGLELPTGYICTDTSCVYGDRLSAYLLPEELDASAAAKAQLAQPLLSVPNFTKDQIYKLL